MVADGRSRRLPVGAECVGSAGVEFRIWAPKRRRVEVVLEGGPGQGTRHACTPQADGYHSALVGPARAGTRYRFALDGGQDLYPDPASRAQPTGPHGPSEVVDPLAFDWSDDEWGGVEPSHAVVYEMHVGTYTPQGTWAAATARLLDLANLGVTMVEMMPVADFPGRFGWGYDGVNLFAPTRLYGTPDDMRRFVDRAHALGLAVILDVVYNHFGPDGNYLAQFSDQYFHTRTTEWGPAINYDGEGSAGVRALVVSNARYWIEEYHFDEAPPPRRDPGHPRQLRRSDRRRPRARRPRRCARPARPSFVAENEPQEARLVRAPERKRAGGSTPRVERDDVHHAARVALTGRSEAYYTDYAGTPQELVSAMKHGFLFQGQHYAWQKKARGTPSFDVPRRAFVAYLENHDQVGNSAFGERLHATTSRGRHRALATLVLLGPMTPLLFQGEEFDASSPFIFFADHAGELAAQVREGRRSFLAQFPSIARPDVAALLPVPDDPATFQRCKIDWAERERNATTLAFYRDLLALRRDDRVFAEPAWVDGAVLSPSAFVLRSFGPGAAGDDRLIVVNLGPDLPMPRMSEPLLAPPEGRRWIDVLATEDARYGGTGAPALAGTGSWQLQGEAARVLRAVPSDGPGVPEEQAP